MPVSPISALPENEQQELLADLNYLNTAEIKSFCQRHGIPYAIAIEAEDGRRRKTNEDDRKGIILYRIRHFLTTGKVLPETCFPADIVCFDSLSEKLFPGDRLFYGQYDKTSRAMISLLQRLTKGKFRDGAMARIIAREFWSRGQAPTYQEYASAWLQAIEEYTRPNPEWAFLSDRAKGTAGSDWKKLRGKKARKVIALLKRIVHE